MDSVAFCRKAVIRSYSVLYVPVKDAFTLASELESASVPLVTVPLELFCGLSVKVSVAEVHCAL